MFMCEYMFACISLGIYLGLELLDHMVTLNSLRTAKLFFEVAAPFYIPPAISPDLHQHFLLSVCVIIAVLVGMK